MSIYHSPRTVDRKFNVTSAAPKLTFYIHSSMVVLYLQQNQIWIRFSQQQQQLSTYCWHVSLNDTIFSSPVFQGGDEDGALILKGREYGEKRKGR